MVTDIDIYRSAKILVDKHGEWACFTAMTKIQDHIDKQDYEGARVWERIEIAASWMTSSTELVGGLAANDC
jgi:hypothetical protein